MPGADSRRCPSYSMRRAASSNTASCQVALSLTVPREPAPEQVASVGPRQVPGGRPVVPVPGRRWIEPNLAISAKATPASQRELEELWSTIVEQVAVRDELALGVQLEAPPHATGHSS